MVGSCQICVSGTVDTRPLGPCDAMCGYGGVVVRCVVYGKVGVWLWCGVTGVICGCGGVWFW